MATGIRIEGLDELNKTLSELAPREAVNILRSTVHGVAGEVRDEMRRGAPEDSGDLKKSIFTQRRRVTGDDVISDVRIRHGKGQKYNAWYWRFLEFGTVDRPRGDPFIVPAVERIAPRMNAIFREQFGKKFEAAMVRKAKRAKQ
jgi:HK97 gp10 family phage protein